MEQQPAKPRYWQGIYLDADETPVTTIYKHPIGALAIAVAGLAAILAVIILFALIFPGSFAANPSAAAGAVLLLSGILAFFDLIAIYIYRQNKLLVTNKHLALVTQRSLINRKISQMSMRDVEDANAEQTGLLATAFGYGTLTVETAGERENFVFTMCPNPSQRSDQVLQAREDTSDGGE
jgi:membrane protein YdbS with pleckstrin-like domain